MIEIANIAKVSAWEQFANISSRLGYLENALNVHTAQRDSALNAYMSAKYRAFKFTFDKNQQRDEKEYQEAVSEKNLSWDRVSRLELIVSDLEMTIIIQSREKAEAEELFFTAYRKWSDLKYFHSAPLLASALLLRLG